MNKQFGANRMRVMFLVPSLRRAGGEAQVVDLANGLDATTFEKHLVVFESDLAQLGRVDRESVVFHHVLRKTKYDISVIEGLARLIDECNIDIVHCTFQFSMLVGWLAVKRSRRKPKIVTALHTTIKQNRREGLLNIVLYQWLLGKCAAVVFVCKNQQDYWFDRHRFLKCRSVVIYNGIDTSEYERTAYEEMGHKLREQCGIPDDVFVCCCIAGFRPEKGHRHLLSAFSTLPASAHLLLAGDGVCRAQIESQVVRHGLTERVHLLGNIDDVRSVLCASNVSVLASTAVETFSIAMLESLSMQVPMVASDIGGMAEAVIHGENGYLFKPGDSGRLSIYLRRLMGDKEMVKRMGEEGRKQVVKRFQLKAMLLQTKIMLEGVGMELIN